MNYWKIVCFLPFVFVAVSNLRVAIGQLRDPNSRSSFVPLVGLVLFFIGTLCLNGDYSPWIWLFVLLDMGTVVLIVGLPFVLKEWFINRK